MAKVDGRKAPVGKVTVGEVARNSGYSSAHINKLIQTGEIADVTKWGGRNYLNPSIIGFLAKRKTGLENLKSAVNMSGKSTVGGGIGSNPASQFVIGSQKKNAKSSADGGCTSRRPPGGVSTMATGGWRVERPLSPVPAGAGEAGD